MDRESKAMYAKVLHFYVPTCPSSQQLQRRDTAVYLTYSYTRSIHQSGSVQSYVSSPKSGEGRRSTRSSCHRKQADKPAMKGQSKQNPNTCKTHLYLKVCLHVMIPRQAGPRSTFSVTTYRRCPRRPPQRLCCRNSCHYPLTRWMPPRG